MMPKSKYAGAHSTYSRLCPAIGITVRPKMIEGWRRIDQQHIHGSDYKEQQEVKERRKKRKRQKSRMLSFTVREGQCTALRPFTLNDTWGAEFSKLKSALV